MEHTLRRYLDEPPSEAELRTALTALGLEPWDITRMSEPLAHELGLKDMARDARAWIRLLAEHPKLIQRPLVLTDDGRAWVARDDETLTERGGRRTAPSRHIVNDGPLFPLVAVRRHSAQSHDHGHQHEKSDQGQSRPQQHLFALHCLHRAWLLSVRQSAPGAVTATLQSGHRRRSAWGSGPTTTFPTCHARASFDPPGPESTRSVSTAGHRPSSPAATNGRTLSWRR